MRTLIQRVQHASVTINGEIKSQIGNGMLVLVGIEDRDRQPTGKKKGGKKMIVTPKR